MKPALELVLCPDEHVLGCPDAAEDSVGPLLPLETRDIRPRHDDHEIVIAVRPSFGVIELPPWHAEVGLAFPHGTKPRGRICGGPGEEQLRGRPIPAARERS